MDDENRTPCLLEVLSRMVLIVPEESGRNTKERMSGPSRNEVGSFRNSNGCASIYFCVVPFDGPTLRKW